MPPNASLMVDAVSENPTSTSISDAVYRTLYARSSEFRKAAAGTSIKKLTIEDACKGRGYLSSVLKATVEFSSERSKPFTFIMKIPDQTTVDTLLSSSSNIPYELATSIVAQVMNGHNTECEFYDVFSGCSSLPLPSVYSTQRTSHGSKNGGILMEHVNGVPQNRLVDLTDKQVKSCIRALANFHACALSHRSRWSRRFNKSSLFVGPYAEMPRHMLPQLLQFDPSIAAVTDKLMNAFGNSFAQYALVGAVDALGLPRVLCHGDFWTNNILWKPADDGRPSDSLSAIIDWQFPFAGNPMFDLARLFVTSMDPERRRTVEGWAIQYYYDTMRHLRCTGFELRKLTAAYKLAMINQAVHAITMPIYVSHATCNNDSAAEATRICLLSRTKAALEDAVDALREVSPQFLNA